MTQRTRFYAFPQRVTSEFGPWLIRHVEFGIRIVTAIIYIVIKTYYESDDTIFIISKMKVSLNMNVNCAFWQFVNLARGEIGTWYVRYIFISLGYVLGLG